MSMTQHTPPPSSALSGAPAPAGQTYPTVTVQALGAVQTAAAWMKRGAFGLVVLAILELALPAALKPSSMLGAFMGNLNSNDLRHRQAATAEFERALAIERARIEAGLRAEAEMLRQQQEAVQRSQGGLQLGAMIGDVACLWGSVDPTSGLQRVCGLSDSIRRDMIQQMERASTTSNGQALRRY